MANDNCITLKDVAIGYMGNIILSNINFSLKKGEFVVLFGPNGAGKTTLFKTILKIIPPEQGEIIYGNDHYPGFGYVPQRQYLDEIYPFTVEEVVLMGTFGSAKPFSPTPGENRALVDQCLKDVDMYDRRKQLFSELSGGQKQRILIARALATRPNVLLLDEPIAGVDIHAQRKIMEIISGLHQGHNLTIIMVTHEIYNIPKNTDRILWIHNNKILIGNRADMISSLQMDEIKNM